MATVTWNGWYPTEFGNVRLVKMHYAEGDQGYAVKTGHVFQCRAGDLVLSWICDEVSTTAYQCSPWFDYGVHVRQGWVAIPAWPRHDRQAAGPFVDNVNTGPSLLRLHYCVRKKMAELRAKEPIGPNTLLTVAYGRSYGLGKQRRARAAVQQAAALVAQAVPRPCLACSYFCPLCHTWLRQKDRFTHRAGKGKKGCQPIVVP